MATAVSARPAQPHHKIKRPQPPSLQTPINGTNSSTPSSSPSMSKKVPPSAKHPPNNVPANSITLNSGGTRVSSRQRREVQRPGEGYARQLKNGIAGRGGSADGIDTERAQYLKKLPPQPYVNTTAHILRKHRGKPPSLILHLHPTHFRFDQQDGSFGYNSPMKVILEHIRAETIPHDMMEEFFRANVRFYDDCLIVQIHDHRAAAAPSSVVSAPNAPNGPKGSPYSIHNYNEHLIPSPYVSYPLKADVALPNGKPDAPSQVAQQRPADQEKENGAAPAQSSADGQNKRPKQPKIYTTVLHPTPLSLHTDITILASTPDPRFTDRRQSHFGHSMNGATPTSAQMPPTPLTSSTPLGPPSKKRKTILDDKTALNFEADYLICTASPLYLKPAENPRNAQMILDALKHPLHQHKPPPPKTRKRTVAELAADEALAAEEERFMLIMDERLSTVSASATAAAMSASGDGQAPGSSFEPRFSRFKVLENIKLKHEENRKKETIEKQKRQQLDLERDRRRLEEEKARNEQQLRLAQQQAAQQAQPQQIQTAQSQQQPQQQQQQQHQQHPSHAHPQQAAALSNAQQQHIQQVSQGQHSSPVIRQHTPHMSSPVVGIGNHPSGGVPMNITASSHGAGSPPRPPSASQHQHPGLAAASHQMNSQRSQQGPSRNGTPQIAQATPNTQHATPVMHQASPTPRMNQGSPVPGMGFTTAMSQHPMSASAPAMQPVSFEQLQRGQAQQHAYRMQQAQAARAQALTMAQLQHQTHRSPQPTAQQMAALQAQQQQHQHQHQQQQGLPQQLLHQQTQLNAQQLQQQQQYQVQMARQQAQMQANLGVLPMQQQGAMGGMPATLAQQHRAAQLAANSQRMMVAQLQQRQAQQGQQIPSHMLQQMQQRGVVPGGQFNLQLQAQQQQIMNQMAGRGGGMVGSMGPMAGIPGQGRGM